MKKRLWILLLTASLVIGCAGAKKSPLIKGDPSKMDYSQAAMYSMLVQLDGNSNGAIDDTKGGTDLASLSANVKSLLGAADYSAIRTLLSLVVGTNVQGYHLNHDYFATLTPATGKVPYFDSASSMNVADSTSYGRSFWNVADEATFKALVNLEVGTDVQAHGNNLDYFSSLSPSADKQPYFDSSSSMGTYTITPTFRTLAALANYPNWRYSLNPIRTSIPNPEDIIPNLPYTFDNNTADPNNINGNDDYKSHFAVDESEGMGTHTGSNNAATLTDSAQSWTVDALIGWIVMNRADNSSCTITDNDATTVTCTLSGGTDNDWDTGDSYYIGKWVATKKTNGTRLWGSQGLPTLLSSDLNDASSPYLLELSEVKGTQITNYGASGTETYQFKESGSEINVIFEKRTNQTMKVCPASGENLKLRDSNGAMQALSTNECVQNTANEESHLAAWSDETGQIKCASASANWAEETP